jgi:hypothetical protein
MNRIIFLLIILMFASGCVTTSQNLYDTNVSYVATSPDSVSVFHELPRGRKFVKIGEVTVDKASSWAVAERKLKEQTAKLGGNAVYIIKTDSRVGKSGMTMTIGDAPKGGGTNSMLLVTGVAIKYIDNK